MDGQDLSNKKNSALFYAQILILFMVITSCIINISLKNGDNTLWISLLSSSIGLILPYPKLKRCKLPKPVEVEVDI